jgi:RHS repeat-associated protein
MEGAGGVGGLLAVERNVAGSNTWDIRYTHADANGNIIALTNSSGAVSARYRYDAFGKVLNATDVDNSGWVNHNIHGFSSKPRFGNQGLLYYGYRWYSPSLGRWINRDPIEERGGMNLYGFVGNDGVGMWDLLGLARVFISTDCNKAFDRKDPTALEVHEFLEGLPCDCKIVQFIVHGHGTSSSMQLNSDGDNNLVLVDNDADEHPDDVEYDSEDYEGSFTDDLDGHLDDNSYVGLYGCYTACANPYSIGHWFYPFKTGTNITQVLSGLMQEGTFSGRPGRGYGNSWTSTTESIGFTNWYRDGYPVEKQINEAD